MRDIGKKSLSLWHLEIDAKSGGLLASLAVGALSRVCEQAQRSGSFTTVMQCAEVQAQKTLKGGWRKLAAAWSQAENIPVF